MNKKSSGLIKTSRHLNPQKTHTHTKKMDPKRHGQKREFTPDFEKKVAVGYVGGTIDTQGSYASQSMAQLTLTTKFVSLGTNLHVFDS